MEETGTECAKVWIKSESDLISDVTYEKNETILSNNSTVLKVEPKTSGGSNNITAEDNKTRWGSDVPDKVYDNGKRNRVGCPKCDRSFKNRANLKNHLKYVHASEHDTVECEQCFKNFKTIAHLRSHLVSVHAEEKLVKCNQCAKTFLNKKRLDNHIFYSHPKSNIHVTCDLCKKNFKQKYSLKVHMRQVHPAESSSVKCPQCDKQFKVPMLLQRHMKWSHPADGMTYPCQECGKIMRSIAGYKKHLENVHSNELQECDVCFKSFKSRKTLMKHIKCIHREEKSNSEENVGHLPCSECGVKFKTNSALSLHFEKNHYVSENGNVCHVCSQEFTGYGCLKRHLKTVHLVESAICHICEKMFRSLVHVQRHIRVTHAAPTAAQVCQLCHKTFKCSMHLRIHVNAVHAKGGSFKCVICDKEFASKKYMLKHQKIHVETKQFPCDICGKYYKCITDVNKHMKRVHGKKAEKSDRLPTVRGVLGVASTSDEINLGHMSHCGEGNAVVIHIKVESDETLASYP